MRSKVAGTTAGPMDSDVPGSHALDSPGDRLTQASCQLRPLGVAYYLWLASTLADQRINL
ncbi:hypothetical protein ACFHYQ_07910 [Sphaerimonospora cavernae]|uniref:Uncharacterized protein n=1 Tax=Sphaerimonospora cavernae TaxID=1740611 RepID=A0ABV6U181_9ACTN